MHEASLGAAAMCRLYRSGCTGSELKGHELKSAGLHVTPHVTAGEPSPPEGRANSTKRASTVDRKSVRRRRCERAVGESRIAADEVEAVDLCRDSCIGRSK